MPTIKRDRWTEADVAALPNGEHDYFDRKSGQLFNGQPGPLLDRLAKAMSAFANSGGGHLILGVDDNGLPDGVPPMQGNTPTREWLEQKIPNLVAYELSDFRVHVVERSANSRIPVGRDVIVIDVGDSALAPHQCLHGGQGIYYYRQAGHSKPAPHFYLELLRQRLIAPVLEVELVEVRLKQSQRFRERDVFVSCETKFIVRNSGRVAAYKWAVQVLGITGPVGREFNYQYGLGSFPRADANWTGLDNMRLDDTILSGGGLDSTHFWGVMLHPNAWDLPSITAELESVVLAAVLRFRVVSETSPGEAQDVEVRSVFRDAESAAARLLMR